MGKKLNFLTRSLGSEPDPAPDPETISRWIATRRGIGGDLTSYHLESLLSYQKDAGIDTVAAGGLFYRSRVIECLDGIQDGWVVSELGLDPAPAAVDIHEAIHKSPQAWASLPSPGCLGLKDRYYGDDEEWKRVLHVQYRRLMREMRDAGAGGTILISTLPDEEEMESFKGKKVLLFFPEPVPGTLEMLIEHQDTIAVDREGLACLLTIIEEYPVENLIIIDPGRDTISRVLEVWEPDHVAVGGYCRKDCPVYWRTVSERSIVDRGSIGL
jgi:hypothetical protein